ncbi:hypothetical protein U1763_10550 [Sphingomonas sp. LB2R24]
MASIAVYVLSQASDRDKDRALERYKLDADKKIAQAYERAENAQADAESARAEAERAKLETAQVDERLALTQLHLDDSNKISLFTPTQIGEIVKGFIDLDLADTQIAWGAANDRQAQRRLLQLTTAFVRADQRLRFPPTAGSVVAPAGERGEVLVHYWSPDREAVARKIERIFRAAGVDAHTYMLPPEPDSTARDATKSLLLIGIAARTVPVYRKKN